MPASKKPTKVMDGVHPGDTPPPSSGRPVIVTNRPILTTDPMLSTDAVDTGEEKPSGESAATPSGVPKFTHEAKDIAPQQATDETAEPESESKPESESAPEKPEVPPAEKPEGEALSYKDKIHITPPNEVKSTPDEESSEVKDDSDDSSEDDDSAATPEQAERAEEDPKTAKEHEIERHIAAGTYFVPIGQAKRRRMAIAFIVFLVLIATLIALNILLDLDILTLNLPHTNFLNN